MMYALLHLLVLGSRRRVGHFLDFARMCGGLQLRDLLEDLSQVDFVRYALL